MPLYLPTWPGPSSMTPRPISSRNETRPATGAGPVGRNLRPGTRWAWDIELPPMPYVDSLEWDDLLEEGDTVVMEIHQPGLVIGNPGAPLIDGANQSGRTLNLKQVEPGYVFRKGQWLSMILNGQRFAYKSRARAVADGAGKLALPLRTMLRVPTLNNAVVEIAQPMAEGWASPDPDSFEVGVDGLVAPRFTLEERE
jgi:hypothetical protein